MVRATVVWLNYNSKHFIDIALRSLESFLKLDFNNYELIIVDNASTDGSFDIIKKHAEKHKPSFVRLKIVKSEKNLGYAGGMNLGWDARDPDSKYIAFVNNDVIAHPSSLAKIIEHLQLSNDTVAASGLLYANESSTIYSAGVYTDELLGSLPACGGLKIEECPSARREQLVTYADGAYLVASVEAIRECGFNGRPFVDETFLYADDILLGIKLWNCGKKVVYVPGEAGIHFANLTTKASKMLSFYPLRGRFILHALIKTKFFKMKYLYYLRAKYFSYILCKLGLQDYCKTYIAISDGFRIGKKLAKIYGFLELYKAPYIQTSSYIVALRPLLPIKGILWFVKGRKVAVTHEMAILPYFS